MKRFFIAALFLIISACDTGPKVDYIDVVQKHESAYPGIFLKQYVEDLAKITKAMGSKVVSGGWTWERSPGGHTVKYNLEENGIDVSFVWLIDSNGRIVPQNKLAIDVTR